MEMVENLSNDLGPGDERNDPKFRAALTEERVGFENSLNQICPSSSESGALARGELRLVGRLVLVG